MTVTNILKLRSHIYVQPVNQGSDNLLLFSCQLGFSEPLALKEICAPILRQLVAGFSADDIESISKTTGFSPVTINDIISLLDAQGYLEGESFRQKKLSVLENFKNLETRAASHAGHVYPSEPEELAKFIEQIISKAPEVAESKELSCLVAPHIDYQRGSLGYAFSYRYLSNCKPDICIVLGTSHKGGQSLFQLTRKHFASPIAIIQNELEFTEKLIDRYGAERALADEFLHRDEHSLELQMPFLSVLCPQTKIVPILVNGFYQHLAAGCIQGDEYENFLSALTDTYLEYSTAGKKIMFIAGVDMAHIGEDFGDPFVIDPLVKDECKRRDTEYLQTFQNLSSKEMFSHIASDRDARRICGFSTLHTVIDLLKRLKTKHEVLVDHYEQSVSNNSRCLVSFAAAHII